MELTLTDFMEGISWWLQESKWPRDFHNKVYYELYDLKKSGLSDAWWNKTVDRLWDWRAIRPLTKTEIRERGLKVLPLLQRMYLNLCAKTEDEPLFLDFKWQQIVDLYDLLANIKASNSPVFPSKLGHFIFPKLFIAMDRKATGTHNYKVFWQSMHKAWSNFKKKEEAKKILLEEIVKYSTKMVHEHYPFEIKIIELSIIGKRLKTHYRRNSTATADLNQLAISKRREVAMKTSNDSSSCQHCRFSVQKLKQMAEKQEMFETWGRQSRLNIHEVNTESGYLVMQRSTGNLTNKLPIERLIRVHDLVHSGGLRLDPDDIGKEQGLRRWDNYLPALLRHLGCQEII